EPGEAGGDADHDEGGGPGQAFRFLVHTPAKAGDYKVKVVQRYNTGEIVKWDGDPGSKTPGPVLRGRIQPVSARRSASFSDGFMNPRVLRGRLFRLLAMRARSSAPRRERSVPLGMYWRKSRFVFSFEPRCQGLWGSQK